MKRIIRYMLDGDGTVPKFVLDGGYFPSAGELIGVSVDEDMRHVPSSVARMNKEELSAWISATQTDMKGKKVTKKAAEEIALRFMEIRGL